MSSAQVMCDAARTAQFFAFKRSLEHICTEYKQIYVGFETFHTNTR